MSNTKGYPKKLFVFERTELLQDRAEIEAFLKAHPKVAEMTYLAYVRQFQRYDPSFRGDVCTDEYALKDGDEFKFPTINRPLVYRDKEINPEDLAHEIKLEYHGLAVRIEDSRDSRFVSDKSGSIENTLSGTFNRALTEWTTDRNVSHWHWMKHYPHLSIATVSLPKFTDEIIAAGNVIGAQTTVYRE